MKFRNFNLGVRQWLGFGAMLTAMVGVSFFSIDRMSGLREEIDELNGYWIPGMTALSEINLDVSNLRMLQLELALEAFDPAALSGEERAGVWIDSINANIDELRTSDSLHAHHIDNLHSALIEQFDENWDVFLMQFVEMFQVADSEEADSLLHEAGIRFEALSDNLEELIDINKTSAAEAALRARESFVRTRGIIIIVLLGTIVASVIVAGALIRSLTTPIRKLEEAAKAVSAGNLDARINVESEDEIGNLARSFNEMTSSLSTAQQQLIVKEKMASLGQLTAGIAHEIKNPLNFVNNFAVLTREIAEEFEQELEKNQDKPVREVMDALMDLLEDLRFNTEKIAQHGARADGIVRGMLQHSRGRPGERQRVDLNQFLDEYINLAYHGMRASAVDFRTQIVREFDPAVGQMDLVPQDIGRVFINILNNAFQAVHELIQAGSEREPMVKVTTRKVGNEIAISFQDNGPGIPEALIKRIFDPFFTTKPTGQGTGLGLSLSYEIVTQGHNGRMSVESKEGEGATFSIRLPV